MPSRGVSAFGLVLVVLTGCKATRQGEPPLVPHALPDRVTGANIRAVGDSRRGYGSAKARETMRRLRRLGVNTLSILLEARMDGLEDVEVRLPDEDTLADTRAVLRDAHRMGFATILIPHIYLDDGQWRGRIAHRDARDRDLWWASYGEFIHTAASLAGDSGVSLLSLGVELKAMSSELDTRTRMRWLRDQIRPTYSGLTTYSANWDEAEQVSFWDVVDVVGINGYYPLVPDPLRGAETVARRLSKLHEIAGRDVLVLEVGYRASALSHLRPWEWPEQVDPDVDENAQALAWAAVLSHWLDLPGVRGLLVWVIPTDPDDPASEPANGFNPLNRPAEQVLERAFSGTSERAG